MAATQTGTTLDMGAGTITGSFIVQSRTFGAKEVDSEDFFDEDGALVTRAVYNSFAKTSLVLLSKLSAEPQTDFIEGTLAAHVDFSDLWVDSATTVKTKSGALTTVEMTAIGIS